MYYNKPSQPSIVITIPPNHSKATIGHNPPALKFAFKAYPCSTGRWNSSMPFKKVHHKRAAETGVIGNLVKTWSYLSHSVHYVLFLINLNQGQKNNFFVSFL